jgi:peroxin-2
MHPPTLQTAKRPRVYVQRANQLEAERLDQELLTLLFFQAQSALRFLRPSVAAALAPEVRLALRLSLYSNTVFTHTPSPGKAIYNLRLESSTHNYPIRYGNEPAPLSLRQRLALILLDVLLPYAWARARNWALEEDELNARWLDERLPGSWRRRIWRAMGGVDTAVRALALANYAVFLTRGRYPTLSHRIACVGMGYQNVSATHMISFEFLNRQLVWSGMAEFLVFLTPVLRSARASRIVSSALLRVSRALGVGAFTGVGAGAGASAGAAGSAEIEHLTGDERRRETARGCAECGAGSPNMAHIALPCRHFFCYVCLAVALEKDPGYACKRCGVSVHALTRKV